MSGCVLILSNAKVKRQHSGTSMVFEDKSDVKGAGQGYQDYQENRELTLNFSLSAIYQKRLTALHMNTITE